MVSALRHAFPKKFRQIISSIEDRGKRSAPRFPQKFREIDGLTVSVSCLYEPEKFREKRQPHRVVNSSELRLGIVPDGQRFIDLVRNFVNISLFLCFFSLSFLCVLSVFPTFAISVCFL